MGRYSERSDRQEAGVSGKRDELRFHGRGRVSKRLGTQDSRLRRWAEAGVWRTLRCGSQREDGRKRWGLRTCGEWGEGEERDDVGVVGCGSG